MKIIYVADDDTPFETQEECERYEAAINREYIALDFQKKPSKFADESYYVYLRGEEETNGYLERLRDLGISRKGIEKPGYYMYDEHNDFWKLIYDEIETKKNEMIELGQVITALNELAKEQSNDGLSEQEAPKAEH